MSETHEKLNEQLFNVIANDKDSDEVRLKKVKYLVYLGADVNARLYGKSVLSKAIEQNVGIEVQDFLREKGANEWVISKEEAENFTLSTDKKVCIVSQTTFNYNKFQDLVEIVSKKGYNISVLNTICNATEERQTEARQIAKEVEAMIVIGDKHSSNTQKLFEICNTECEKTYYIQTSKDMDYSLLESINNVGITAGASTPNNIIEEVSKNVRNEL